MTEELAIKIFNHCIEFYTKYCEGEGLQPVITGKEAKAMKIISNLIQKQDTEINKLRQENEQLKSELGYTRKIIYTGDHIPRID